jgi:hypothetical protein
MFIPQLIVNELMSEKASQELSSCESGFIMVRDIFCIGHGDLRQFQPLREMSQGSKL